MVMPVHSPWVLPSPLCPARPPSVTGESSPHRTPTTLTAELRAGTGTFDLGSCLMEALL